jgi:hypothetical protein
MSIVPAGSGFVRAEITRSEIYGSGGHGLVAHANTNWTGSIYTAVESTVSANNGFAGFAAENSPGGTGRAAMAIVRSVSAGNTKGIATGNGFTEVSVGSSLLLANGSAWPDPLTVSWGDNYLAQNGGGAPNAAFTLQRK